MAKTIQCRHEPRISCSDCALSEICLPPSLEANEIQRLDDIIGRNKPIIHKGEHLYRQDDPFNSIYAIRSGSVKYYNISNQGAEHVSGFCFPGEIVGMDGIGRNRHASSAVALETSSVCKIPFDRLQDLSREIPVLQNRCFQLMSQEIVDDRVLMNLLSKAHAEARVAAFFLSVSERKSRRKLLWSEFRLPMSRNEIANYLGLTVETVSRILNKLQKMNVLNVKNKDITIHDVSALKRMASS